jgi:hypothetical protein
VERNAANAEREVGPPPLTLSVSARVIQCGLCNFVQAKNILQHDSFCAVCKQTKLHIGEGHGRLDREWICTVGWALSCEFVQFTVLIPRF